MGQRYQFVIRTCSHMSLLHSGGQAMWLQIAGYSVLIRLTRCAPTRLPAVAKCFVIHNATFTICQNSSWGSRGSHHCSNTSQLMTLSIWMLSSRTWQHPPIHRPHLRLPRPAQTNSEPRVAAWRSIAIAFSCFICGSPRTNWCFLSFVQSIPLTNFTFIIHFVFASLCQLLAFAHHPGTNTQAHTK